MFNYSSKCLDKKIFPGAYFYEEFWLNHSVRIIPNRQGNMVCINLNLIYLINAFQWFWLQDFWRLPYIIHLKFWPKLSPYPTPESSKFELTWKSNIWWCFHKSSNFFVPNDFFFKSQFFFSINPLLSPLKIRHDLRLRWA